MDYKNLILLANQIEGLSDGDLQRLARLLVQNNTWATGTLASALNDEYAIVARKLGIEDLIPRQPELA